MEYIVEKTQKIKKLGQEDKDSLAKKIVEDFKSYDTARSQQLEKARKLSDEICKFFIHSCNIIFDFL